MCSILDLSATRLLVPRVCPCCSREPGAAALAVSIWTHHSSLAAFAAVLTDSVLSCRALPQKPLGQNGGARRESIIPAAHRPGLVSRIQRGLAQHSPSTASVPALILRGPQQQAILAPAHMLQELQH